MFLGRNVSLCKERNLLKVEVAYSAIPSGMEDGSVFSLYCLLLQGDGFRSLFLFICHTHVNISASVS